MIKLCYVRPGPATDNFFKRRQLLGRRAKTERINDFSIALKYGQNILLTIQFRDRPAFGFTKVVPVRVE